MSYYFFFFFFLRPFPAAGDFLVCGIEFSLDGVSDRNDDVFGRGCGAMYDSSATDNLCYSG